MSRSARIMLDQAAFDLRLLLRNGEQFLLTLGIPIALLLGLTLATAIPLPVAPGSTRVASALAGVLAVAVLSSAFASLAIGVGFDRRSGALLLLATTPLSRGGILLARSLATVAVVAVQTVLLCLTAVALGWRGEPSALMGVPLLLLGTLSLGACGFALGGAVRAEATLAIANAVFLLLLVAGGTAWPPSSLPGPLASIVALLPSAALGDGLRMILAGAPGGLIPDVIVLLIWGAIGAFAAVRTFRWK